MYVQPNSTIKLLHNVPLDDRYTDTAWFNDKNAQASAFNIYTKRTFSAQTYQRVNKNRIRLEVPFNDVCDCNYLMFQNTSFGTKWWYAFITQVEYINNSVTEIIYRLDPVQNWIVDWTMQPCFIERTHVTDDSIGANIQPEPISGGNRYTGYGVSTMPKGETTIPYNEIKCIYAFAGYDAEQYIQTGQTKISYWQGLPRGISVYKFKSDEMDLLNDWLRDCTVYQVVDSIIGMYAFYGYYDGTDDPQGEDRPTQREWHLNSDEFDLPFIKNIMGYEPRNNKLYTFPYNVIRMDNGNGDSAFYRYEFFGKDASGKIDPTFVVDGAITCPPQMLCRPSNYVGDSGESFSDSLGLRDFPQVPYSINGFLAWLSNNFIPTTLSFAGGVMGGAVGATASQMLSAENVGKAEQAYNSASQRYVAQPTGQNQRSMMNAYEHYNQAVQHAETTDEIKQMELASSVGGKILNEVEMPLTGVQSHAGSSSILFALGFLEFEAFQECISRDMAEMIDSYFDRFGYAINKTQTPNLLARRHYTYIKTKGCKISGDIPNDDRHTIESIFDNGITVWRSLAEVGDYSQAIMAGNVIV